jgi:5-methylcytosine-specific restriction endonuclease McrA
MPRRPHLTAAMRRQVAAREGYRCAYCRCPQRVGIPMVVDHVLPLAAGGSSRLENLCLACYRCNEFKGWRTEGPDPVDSQMTPLFHPRRDAWAAHFAWQADRVTSLASPQWAERPSWPSISTSLGG